MHKSNGDIINKGSTTTDKYNSGLLNPEQSEAFMRMVFDDSSFLGELRHEMRNSTKGTIEKLGIGRRILRKKDEATILDKEHWTEPLLGSVPYSTVDMVLSAEVSEKFMRENIEKENFEYLFMEDIAKQTRIDMLDLAFNGDEDYTGEDEAFITMNDGVIKLLSESDRSNKVDASSFANGKFIDDIFTTALKVLPSKYINNNFRWMASNKTYITWLEYLKQKDTTAGDMAILNGTNMNPLNIEWEIIPNMPDDKIILADPKNFAVITTYDMKLRKTDEGKEAVLRDTRYYALHLDMDTIVMEDEATVIIDNVPNQVK